MENFNPSPEGKSPLDAMMEKTRIGEMVMANLARSKLEGAKKTADAPVRALLIIALYREAALAIHPFRKADFLEHLTTAFMHSDPEVMLDVDGNGKTHLDKAIACWKADEREMIDKLRGK